MFIIDVFLSYDAEEIWFRGNANESMGQQTNIDDFFLSKHIVVPSYRVG
ncbi:hypothetical protein PN836_001645 [Ningiella sp. W23]